MQPEDVVAFLEQFLRGHSIRARTFTEAGERVVHFNTVEKEVSHLCSWFRRHGAEGEWRTNGSQGNPCKLDCVRTWKRTYRAAQHVRGVGESSTEPLTLDWYRRMLTACQQEVRSRRDMLQRGCAARDALMLSFLWETG